MRPERRLSGRNGGATRVALPQAKMRAGDERQSKASEHTASKAKGVITVAGKDESPRVERADSNRSKDIPPTIIPAGQTEPMHDRIDRDPEDDPTLRPLLWSRFSQQRSSMSSKFLALVPDTFANFSIRPPHTHRDIVVKIAGQSRLPIESLPEDLDQPVFTGACAIFGYVGDQIDAIARNYARMRWWVSDSGLNMAILSSAEIMGKPTTVLIGERAARRLAVVMPILAKKGWKRGRLATEAGLGKNSVYQYLDGTRAQITDANRTAIADALGLKPDQLPD